MHNIMRPPCEATIKPLFINKTAFQQCNLMLLFRASFKTSSVKAIAGFHDISEVSQSGKLKHVIPIPFYTCLCLCLNGNYSDFNTSNLNINFVSI